MKSGPSPVALLDLARETLRRDVLPTLPAESKYGGLMVLSALTILGRELGSFAEIRKASVTHLRMVLGCAASNSDDAELERKLCALIREGAFDSKALSRELASYLLAATNEALRDVNPALIAACPEATAENH